MKVYWLLFILLLTLVISEKEKEKEKEKNDNEEDLEEDDEFIEQNQGFKYDPDDITYKTEDCDFIVDNAICIFNKSAALMMNAKPDQLLLHLSFDEEKAYDQSGNKNHALQKCINGPSFLGQGYSALFNGFDFIELPHIPLYFVKQFTITFWYFMLRESDEENLRGLRYCPIMQKGIDDTFEKIYYRSPAIFIDKKQRNLKIVASTSDIANQAAGEILMSNGKIQYQRWTHITVSFKDKILKLYINGVLDNVLKTVGNLMPNNMPLFIGNTPWHKDDCNVASMIDELRFYGKELSVDYIQAEAQMSLSGVEPNFIQFGCIDCNIEQAVNSCHANYHLCTSIELYTGGYQVARTLGWATWDGLIWSHSIWTRYQQQQQEKALQNAQLQDQSNQQKNDPNQDQDQSQSSETDQSDKQSEKEADKTDKEPDVDESDKDADKEGQKKKDKDEVFPTKGLGLCCLDLK